MRVVRWEAEARAQFRDILTYIADRNIDAAENLDAEVKRRLALLTKFPDMGRPGRVVPSRELVIHPNYILIYVVKPKSVDVVRFLHARQQYP